MIIKENQISVYEYLKIREKVGWKKLSKTQAAKALDNSLFIVGAYEDGELIAMGRIVGDGAVICYVQDLIVVPDNQSMGIGSEILKKLILFVNELKEKDTEMMLCLMCAKGREEFYEKYGFVARPTEDLGPGMIQYLRKL